MRTNNNDKKWTIIKIVGLVVFLITGAVFGLIAANLNGWDFMKMINDPKTWLFGLCFLSIGIMALSNIKIK